MDDCCNTDSFVVAWVGDELHDGGVHPHRTGDCNYCCGGWLYSGSPWVVNGRFTMRPKILIAVILIALGIVAFVYQGITYTTREKVVDFGPIQVTAEKTKTLPFLPILGAIALVGGIVLLVMGNRKRL